MKIDKSIKIALSSYESRKFAIEQFLKTVYNFFADHPKLNEGALPIIHSIKRRMKSPDHLIEKIKRKWDPADPITEENLFSKITDFAGIRILHLYQAQFEEIHTKIKSQIDDKEWYYDEDPKAYTWDPESKKFYENLGIRCEIKDTFYTSIHYIVKPRSDSDIKCEIQIRTLFEEVWGEIDHSLNYPSPTDSIACGEQLRVLAKLASTGTRLADSIFLSYKDHKKKI